MINDLPILQLATFSMQALHPYMSMPLFHIHISRWDHHHLHVMFRLVDMDLNPPFTPDLLEAPSKFFSQITKSAPA